MMALSSHTVRRAHTCRLGSIQLVGLTRSSRGSVAQKPQAADLYVGAPWMRDGRVFAKVLAICSSLSVYDKGSLQVWGGFQELSSAVQRRYKENCSLRFLTGSYKTFG